MHKHACSAIVLAGGCGARLGGCNKAALTMGGERFMDRLARELNGFGELILSVNDPDVAAGTAYRPVRDGLPGQGPLGGLCAALRASRFAHALTVPCDMPLFSGELAAWMLDQYGGEDILACRTGAGKLHPLCGIYRKGCLDVLEENLRQGRLKITRLLEEVHSRIVDVPAPFQNQFININTPDDLRQLQAWMQP